MSLKQIHVLLLEDEASHAEAIRRALESSGQSFVIEVVNSLKQFREHVSSNPPDIALLDMVCRTATVLTCSLHRWNQMLFPC